MTFHQDGPPRPHASSPSRPARHLRLSASARTAVAALALALGTGGVAATSAQAVGNGVLATSAPVVYPGTTTPIDSWRLIGGGDASATQVAPRWVLASGHAPANGLWTHDRGSTGADAVYIPKNSAGVRVADVSLTLLTDPLPAPQSGWPRLLTTQPGDLVNVLPGQVLFAGFGGTSMDTLPVPNVGWATPAGLRAPGEPRLQAINGDSGSSAFWHPTPSAPPVITAITSAPDVAETTPWTINMQRTFWQPLPEAPVGSSATTIGEWIREQIAKHPEATPPTWVELDEVVSLDTLRPLPPTNVRVSSSTATSISVAWDHPADTRAARTGYRVTWNGGSATVPASSTLFRATGLTVGQRYTLSVRALNDHGESPIVEGTPSEVSYDVRTPPGAVRDTSITEEKSIDPGFLTNYCAEARWTAPAAVAGTTVTSYDVRIDGVRVPSSDVQQLADSERWSVRRCGFEPSSNHTFSIGARSDQTPSAYQTSLNLTIQAGAPLGTVILPATGISAVPRMSTLSGKVDYCIDVAWTAPDTIDGWPVIGYTVDQRRAGTSLGLELQVAPSERTATNCGLNPGLGHNAMVGVLYTADAGRTAIGPQVVTPAGAPNGTPITPVSGVKAPITTRLLASSCANVSWTLPAPVAGAPITSHQVLITPSTGGSAVATSAVLAGSATAVRLCGVSVTKTYKVTVTTKYAGGGTVTATGTAAR